MIKPKVIGTQAELDAMFKIDRSMLACSMTKLAADLVDNLYEPDFSAEQWSDLLAKFINLRQSIDHTLETHFNTNGSEVPQSISDYDGDIDPCRVSQLRRSEEPPPNIGN